MEQSGPEQPANPYRGPKPFSEKEQMLFFGRDAESRDLSSLIVAHREVVLYSQSGAGKTSLLHAGVFPRLRDRGLLVLPTARVVGEPLDPETRAGVKNIYSYYVLKRWAPAGEAQALVESSSLKKYLTTRRLGDEQDEQPRLRIVLFDQFEELFTTHPERWRDRETFLAEVAAALEEDGRLRVLFALREEYVGRLRKYADLFPEHLRTWVQLERLREAQAEAAVEEPARLRGVTYAAGIAENLVRNLMPIRVPAEHGGFEEVQGEFVEPVHLQIVCQKIWNNKPEGVTEITAAHITEFGNVDEALREYFHEKLDEVARETGISRAKLLTWFNRRLIVEGRRTRVFESGGKVAGLPTKVAERFREHYLLRSDMQGDMQWFELAHDRLVAPVRLEAERRRKELMPLQYFGWAAAIFLALGAAAVWYSAGLQVEQAQQQVVALEIGAEFRPQEEIDRVQVLSWRGNLHRQAQAEAEKQLITALDSALRAYRGSPTSEQWTPFADGLRYGLNSVRRARAEASSVRAEEARAKEAKQKGVKERRRSREDILQARVADLKELVTTTRIMPSLTEPAAAGFSEDKTRLAIWDRAGVSDPQEQRPAAGRGRPSVVRARPTGSLLALIDVSSGRVIATIEHVQQVETVLTADGGKRIALVERPGRPEVLQLLPANQLRALTTGHISPGLVSLALGARGGLVAAGAWDGTGQIWNASTRGKIRDLAAAGPTLWDLSFSPDEAVVALARDDGTVTLWDSASGKAVRSLARQSKAVRRVVFSPKGDLLATAGWDNQVKLWNRTTGAQLATLSGHTRPVNSVAFAPSGQELVSAASDGTLKLWKIDGALVRTMSGHKRSVRDVTFSPNGALIASAAADRTVRVWDARTGEVRSTLTHNGTVWSVAFSPNSSMLATASEDGAARIWDVASSKTLATLRETSAAATPVNEAYFSRDNARVLTVGGDDTLRWWDWRAGREVDRLFGHESATPSISAALNRAGSRLALLDARGDVRIVDPDSDRVLSRFSTMQTAAQHIVFSPDGKLIATLGSSPPLRIWESEGGRPVETIEAPQGTFDVVAIDSTGARVAAIGREAAPVVWTRGQPGQRSLLRLATPSEPIRSLAFSPGGNLLVGVSREERLEGVDRVEGADRLYVWSLQTGYLIATVPTVGSKPVTVTFTDGSTLAALSDAGLEKIDTRKIYEDASTLLATAFDLLSTNSPLNRGVAQALRGEFDAALATLSSLKPGSSEFQRARTLNLLELVGTRTLTPAALVDFFPATPAASPTSPVVAAP